MNDTDPADPSDRPNAPTHARLRDLPRAAPAQLRPHDPGVWNRVDRPFIVSVIGWLCAAIGYLSFFLKGSQLPAFFMDMKWMNPNWIAPQLTRWQFMGGVSILIAEMFVGLLAIAGGLGSLKMREWGRRAAIYYAVTAIIVGLLKAAFQIATFDTQIDQRIATTMMYIDRNAMANREFFYLVTTTIAGFIWPALVIASMTRAHVRAAFAKLNRSTAAPQDDWRSN